MQSSATPNTGFAVQSDLMKFFDPHRVEAHVVYNRRPPHGEAYRPGTSLEGVLREIPGLHLRPTEFGPHLGGLGKPQLAGELLRSALPSVRDHVGLVHYVRHQGIDVIHGGENPREAFYGWWLSRVTGAKCLIHMHVKYDPWISRLTRYAMRNVDGVVTVSRWCSEQATRAGVKRERIFTVLNGIEVDAWDPSAVDGAAIRREFGVDQDTALLAVVAALRPWKGHVTLLEALGRVVRSHPKVKLLVVGTEDRLVGSRPGSYTDELKQLAAELGVAQNVVFTGLRRDVRQIHAAADLFTFPTNEDPCPLAVLESMAMRTPVLAAQSGGVPELVEHGVTGLLSQPGNSEELAHNITWLLDNPVVAREMGDSARKRVLEQFTAQRMANDFERLYRTLVSR